MDAYAPVTSRLSLQLPSIFILWIALLSRVAPISRHQPRHVKGTSFVFLFSFRTHFDTIPFSTDFSRNPGFSSWDGSVLPLGDAYEQGAVPVTYADL